MYRYFFKRFFDIVISLITLAMFSSILILIFAILLCLNKGKPLFLQVRTGKNGKLFKMIKYRTMNDKKDKEGNLLPDNERITKFGKFLRKTSLDEGLQTINVLIGDMTIVGPRPLLPEYLKIYSLEQNRRHEVKPGITGWAQINGRNAISWAKKFEYDVWYVDNLNFLLDLKIFFITVKKVFKSEGVTSENHATIEKFNGKN